MRLTTKGRYAVTAMLDIALYADDGPVSVQDIARRQDISSSYLEQIVGQIEAHRSTIKLSRSRRWISTWS